MSPLITVVQLTARRPTALQIPTKQLVSQFDCDIDDNSFIHFSAAFTRIVPLSIFSHSSPALLHSTARCSIIANANAIAVVSFLIVCLFNLDWLQWDGTRDHPPLMRVILID
eukprot:scaffold53454_cov55-Cyclotella_meneghiniana.AAC.2